VIGSSRGYEVDIRRANPLVWLLRSLLKFIVERGGVGTPVDESGTCWRCGRVGVVTVLTLARNRYDRCCCAEGVSVVRAYIYIYSERETHLLSCDAPHRRPIYDDDLVPCLLLLFDVAISFMTSSGVRPSPSNGEGLMAADSIRQQTHPGHSAPGIRVPSPARGSGGPECDLSIQCIQPP
jgi:hypothetical protein